MNRDSLVTRIVRIGLLMAAEIVLSRFLSVSTPVVRIGFGFVPIALIAMLYGPAYAAAAAGICDFLGAHLFPIGQYIPGLTLTAALAGLVYGLLLYRKPVRLWRVACAATFISLVLHLGLDTIWLSFYLNKAFLAFLPTRILKCLIMIPVISVTCWTLLNRLPQLIKTYRFQG